MILYEDSKPQKVDRLCWTPVVNHFADEDANNWEKGDHSGAMHRVWTHMYTVLVPRRLPHLDLFF